jgi:hypothetical protein
MSLVVPTILFVPTFYFLLLLLTYYNLIFVFINYKLYNSYISLAKQFEINDLNSLFFRKGLMLLDNAIFNIEISRV